MRLTLVPFFCWLAVTPCLAEGDAAVESNNSSASVAVAQPAPARSRADQLDRLFARLQKASTQAEAADIEKSIWANWSGNDSPTAEMLLHQAGVAMNDNELPVAEEILNTVIATYPDYTEALNRRATLYFQMKRYDDSLKDIDKVLEAEPRHFGALSGKGMILREQGKYGAAKAAFAEALAVNPQMQSVQEALKDLRRLAPDI